jgi:SlyX protein
MEERIVELELRYTEQQALLQELSGVLYKQAQQLDLLQAQVRQLELKLQGDQGLVDAQDRERPPHY